MSRLGDVFARAALCLSVCACTALAQPLESVPPGPITDEHVEAMTAHFALDAQQEVALFDLLDGYYTDEQARQEALDDAIDEAEQVEDDEDWGAAEARIDELESEGERAAAERASLFYADVRLLLTPGQDRRWEAWERARRRIDLLPKGSYAGDMLDLARMARRMGVSSRVEELLEGYELDLDAALRRRYEARRVAIERLEDEDEPDARFVRRTMEDARRRAYELADLNRDYARRIGVALGGEEGETFVYAYERGAYPLLFIPSVAERMVALALRIDGIDEGQRAQIEAMEEELERTRERIIPRQIEVWTRQERDFALREGDPDYPFTALGLPDPRLRRTSMDTEELRALRRERRATERDVRRRLDTVLNPEQREALFERAQEIAPETPQGP